MPFSSDPSRREGVLGRTPLFDHRGSSRKGCCAPPFVTSGQCCYTRRDRHAGNGRECHPPGYDCILDHHRLRPRTRGRSSRDPQRACRRRRGMATDRASATRAMGSPGSRQATHVSDERMAVAARDGVARCSGGPARAGEAAHDEVADPNVPLSSLQRAPYGLDEPTRRRRRGPAGDDSARRGITCGASLRRPGAHQPRMPSTGAAIGLVGAPHVIYEPPCRRSIGWSITGSRATRSIGWWAVGLVEFSRRVAHTGCAGRKTFDRARQVRPRGTPRVGDRPTHCPPGGGMPPKITVLPCRDGFSTTDTGRLSSCLIPRR